MLKLCAPRVPSFISTFDRARVDGCISGGRLHNAASWVNVCVLYAFALEKLTSLRYIHTYINFISKKIGFFERLTFDYSRFGGTSWYIWYKRAEVPGLIAQMKSITHHGRRAT